MLLSYVSVHSLNANVLEGEFLATDKDNFFTLSGAMAVVPGSTGTQGTKAVELLVPDCEFRCESCRESTWRMTEYASGVLPVPELPSSLFKLEFKQERVLSWAGRRIQNALGAL